MAPTALNHVHAPRTRRTESLRFWNSAYAAVVSLAVYSAYFQGQVVGGAEGSRLWGSAISIAMISSPSPRQSWARLPIIPRRKNAFSFSLPRSPCCLPRCFSPPKKAPSQSPSSFLSSPKSVIAPRKFFTMPVAEIASPMKWGALPGSCWAIGFARRHRSVAHYLTADSPHQK